MIKTQYEIMDELKKSILENKNNITDKDIIKDFVEFVVSEFGNPDEIEALKDEVMELKGNITDSKDEIADLKTENEDLKDKMRERKGKLKIIQGLIQELINE